MNFIEFTCAFCGSTNELNPDEHTIDSYEIIEDCHVCCRPNTLKIKIVEGKYEIYNSDNN